MIGRDKAELNELELVTRRELAGMLRVGISSLDIIPESELPRVRFGRSVRFTRKSIAHYILRHESNQEGIPPSSAKSRKGDVKNDG